MPKVSVIILTKNRSALLERALASLDRQTFMDVEHIVIDDGSTDDTARILSKWKVILPLRVITHEQSLGITKSRQEALMSAGGKYVAFLDDDDEWVHKDKMKKQAEYLNNHPDVVLAGGGIIVNSKSETRIFRPENDPEIRNSMLFRNNFFTSTVMFRRDKALEAGGFLNDGLDLAEDYDLWLRLGKLGKMYNFQEVFTSYAKPSYNKAKFKEFLKKQLALIGNHRDSYPHYVMTSFILRLRILFGA